MYPSQNLMQIKLRTFLAVIFLCIFERATFAKRYLVPKDENVIVRFNKGREAPFLPREEIKILIWNIYKAGKKNWEKDFKELIKGVDILMLQEFITTPKVLNIISQDKDRTYFLATSFIDRGNNSSRTGVSIASSYQFKSLGWKRSYYREPIIRTPKMLEYAEFNLSGTDKRLLVVNIHAINFVSSRKLEHMVKNGIEIVSRHKGPVVFAGDFNTWSRKKQRMLFRLMKEKGLKNVKFLPDTRMKVFGKVLDFVFLRDLKLIRSKVHGNLKGSDHKAMEVHLSY